MGLDDAVHRETKIHAPPEAIFPYLVDPELALRWHAQEAELDARPGGAYRLNVTGRHVASGEFITIDPPRAVSYTWGWEGSEAIPPGSSVVEITLEPDGEYTIVRVVHRGLPDAEAREQHARGWEHYGARLAVCAAGGDPGPDPWAEEVAAR